ncbi:MAG TPA: adenylate/guanylate cyclase domain-containing protein, partial [Polyangiales bacterium]|nr:adenylate/guanylate cyclase domain-containing protein [Polyangiales bacterium]
MEFVGACGKCGAPLTSTANFCSACGRPARSQPPSSERRQLTVFFCDMAGSTALSERLDPEDFGDLLHGYQRVCRDAIVRHGGHISQFLGDGVLAYFGYPQAHDDDAVRAVRAALSI